jgi:uncharacterized RDD family membrane protein YckC
MAQKTIDITTSQQVVVTYELAGLGNRLLSNCIDIFIVYALNLIVLAVMQEGLSDLFLIQSIGLVWFYHLVFVLFFRGNTLGMRTMKLHIVKPSGGEVAFDELFTRWIFRPIDVTLTLGVLGSFLMLGTDKSQRLGDILAGTVVVRNKQTVNFDFEDIMKFHQQSSETAIKYPKVRHFSDSDMLFVKNTLQNQAGYFRDAHIDAVHACAMRMADLLQIEVPADKQGFLQQLIQDYVALTR